MVEPAENPFANDSSDIISYTRYVSLISDDELDELIRGIRERHHNQGVNMLRGTLRSMGFVIAKRRIRQSLRRLHSERLFTRTTVKRRSYNVLDPNALWHHDGQHDKSCQMSFKV